MRTTHCAVAAVSWLAITPLELAPAVGGALIAFSTGGGPLSPDCDLWLASRSARRGATVAAWTAGAAAASWLTYERGHPWWWGLAIVGAALAVEILVNLFSSPRRRRTSFWGHRKITHYIEWPIIAGFVAWALHLGGSPGWWVLGAAAMAWLSHLILDIFSGKRGVPSVLFGRLQVPAWAWMHTDGWFEHRVFRPFVVLVAFPVVVILRIALDLGAFSLSSPFSFPFA